MVARSESLCAIARTDYLLVGATDFLLVSFRFRLRSRLREGWRRKLSAVSCAGGGWYDGTPELDVLWDRRAVGSPVRIPQGDPGCAGASNLSHDRTHARRGNHRHAPGSIGSFGLHSRGVQATAVEQPCAGVLLC